MTGICDIWCEGCNYLPKVGTICCDYLMTTGHRRPCPAGTGCTVRSRPTRYKPDKRLRERERVMAIRRDLENGQPVMVPDAKRAQELAKKIQREAIREARESMRLRWLAKLTPAERAQRQAILEWRAARGLTQRQAAELVGVNQRTIGDWEMARYRANWTRLEKAGCKRP